MNKYLAKSQPKETIQEHTDNLIKNYNILKEIYPSLKINWDMLYKACLYHDFGKMNLKFQEKIEEHKIIPGEIPHGILSLAFIDFKYLEDNGYSDDDIRILFHTIAYHHERELAYSDYELGREVELLENEYKGFNYKKITRRYISDYIEESFFIKNDRIYEERDKKLFFKYVRIKGLLNRIDYAASGYIDVEIENNFLKSSLDEMMDNWGKLNNKSKWNDLQEYMIQNKEKNVVVVAQTGMGKTEAGLLWIDNNKGFFTLPLKTAINAIYDRVVNIVGENRRENIGLLHSDTLSEYINCKEEITDVAEYYNKTKQLSLPLTICTLDQIFDFVFKYRGFEPKLATLAYSKVVIDEIQMYSPDLLAYLIIGLGYINKVGGKFAILTATLPKFIINLLEQEDIKFEMPKKAFINKELDRRHSIRVIDEDINVNQIIRLYNKNKVIVICNTVNKAQGIYNKLIEGNIENVNLLHSRFIKKHRKDKEDKISVMGKSDNKDCGIWVATQVVEASLDIDFDILVTELSDINGLFQRLGRCYRKRNFNGNDYNCYVYTGGEKKCSGVGNVIDEEIFDLSKKEIFNEKIDGILDEEMKIKIIDDVYAFDKLKETKYYELVRDAIRFVKSIKEYDTSKNEVKKIFRNIDSINVIPNKIYVENKYDIDKYVSTIYSKYEKNLSAEKRKKIFMSKIKARKDLNDFVVPIRTERTKGNIVDTLILSEYENISILDCDYSEEIGVQFKKKLEVSKYEFL